MKFNGVVLLGLITCTVSCSPTQKSSLLPQGLAREVAQQLPPNPEQPTPTEPAPDPATQPVAEPTPETPAPAPLPAAVPAAGVLQVPEFMDLTANQVRHFFRQASEWQNSDADGKDEKVCQNLAAAGAAVWVMQATIRDQIERLAHADRDGRLHQEALRLAAYMENSAHGTGASVPANYDAAIHSRQGSFPTRLAQLVHTYCANESDDQYDWDEPSDGGFSLALSRLMTQANAMPNAFPHDFPMTVLASEVFLNAARIAHAQMSYGWDAVSEYDRIRRRTHGNLAILNNLVYVAPAVAFGPAGLAVTLSVIGAYVGILVADIAIIAVGNSDRAVIDFNWRDRVYKAKGALDLAKSVATQIRWSLLHVDGNLAERNTLFERVHQFENVYVSFVGQFSALLTRPGVRGYSWSMGSDLGATASVPSLERLSSALAGFIRVLEPDPVIVARLP